MGTNIWTIWIRPRETMRTILNGATPMWHVYFLAALGGVAAGVSQLLPEVGEVIKYGAIASYALTFTIIAILMLGPLAGILMVWGGGIMLHWTGRWIGGKGSREQIMAAIAWAQIPSIMLAIGILIFLMIYGLVFLLGVQQIPHFIEIIFGALFAMLLLGVMVWKLIIYFNCLAEAQGFQSAWMAVTNSLISSAIAVAVLIIPLGIMSAILIPMLIQH